MLAMNEALGSEAVQFMGNINDTEDGEKASEWGFLSGQGPRPYTPTRKKKKTPSAVESPNS
jgi:hypothetical protein